MRITQVDIAEASKSEVSIFEVGINEIYSSKYLDAIGSNNFSLQQKRFELVY